MSEQLPLYQAMIAAVSQTLENMVFMEAMEHYDQDMEIPPEQAVWTSLLIHDPVQGEIRQVMTKELLTKFTSNVFGLAEEDVTDSQKNDIMNELLNTIAGLFMTKLLPDDQQYQLGLPELGESDLPEADAEAICLKLMTTDEDPIFIYITGSSLIALNKK